MKSETEEKLLELAELLGILTCYEDVRAQKVRADCHTLISLLKTMGVDLGDSPTTAAVEKAVEKICLRRLQRPLDHCMVYGSDQLLQIRIPEKGPQEVDFILATENQDIIEWTCTFTEQDLLKKETVAGLTFSHYVFQLPENLHYGYHSLTVAMNGDSTDCLLLVAPETCFLPDFLQKTKTWSVFTPVYALRSERNLGVGDWTDLRNLGEWILEKGGAGVATLPMHSLALEGNAFDISPYSPLTRLFWNELYIGLDQILETQDAKKFQEEAGRLRQSENVDYAAVWKLKKAGLKKAFQNLTKQDITKLKEETAISDPLLLEFATFRANTDHDEETSAEFYLYIQKIAHQQLTDLSRYMQSRGGMGLYLDLPLGSHSQGFDVEWFKDSFASGVAVGAPPDAFFSKGQNWGFPPIHPHKLRENKYLYLRELLGRNMSKAGVLRLDHVMGFHRQYWIPEGCSGQQGAYVSYPFHEIYAVLAIESHRHKCAVIGEDLGTVDPAVREHMQEKAVLGMYVLQLEVYTADALPTPSRHKVASLNTHDTPTFQAFTSGADIQLRVDLKISAQKQAEQESRERQECLKKLRQSFAGNTSEKSTDEDLLRQSHKFLAASESPHIVINLEDLWLETQPQNVPGTSTAENTNWQHKLKLPLVAIHKNSSINEQLEEIHNVRS